MKSNKKHRLSKKVGLRPGSVVYIGEERDDPIRLNVIDYNETELQTLLNVRLDSIKEYRNTKNMTWIDICGIHDPKAIEQIGRSFGLDVLVQEDIVNARIRPKLEEFDDYIFIALKMLKGFDDSGNIVFEQVSVVFGRNWVMTLQEAEGDVLGPIRDRLEKTTPRVRFMSSDYLAYAIVDTVVDHYFVLLEHLGERIEELDDSVTESPQPDHLTEIRRLKKSLIFMRKAIWPLREVVSGLQRSESKLMSKSLTPNLRDLYEHVIQTIDSVETFRDLVSGLLDLYNSGISNRMNEIMKVLTIFASIFIPLGFLAGVYGMNFESSASPYNMPELAFKYGYLMFWGLVVTVVSGLVWFFRRRRWL